MPDTLIVLCVCVTRARKANYCFFLQEVAIGAILKRLMT